jgi:hypothetical protein
VVTDPPGAEAWLNGVDQGSTPIQELQVPAAGRQELVLRLKDCKDWVQVLDRNNPLPEPIKLEARLVAASRPGPAKPVTRLAASPVEPAPARPVENRAPSVARPPVETRAPSVVKTPSPERIEVKEQPASPAEGKH